MTVRAMMIRFVVMDWWRMWRDDDYYNRRLVLLLMMMMSEKRLIIIGFDIDWYWYWWWGRGREMMGWLWLKGVVVCWREGVVLCCFFDDEWLKVRLWWLFLIVDWQLLLCGCWLTFVDWWLLMKGGWFLIVVDWKSSSLWMKSGWDDWMISTNSSKNMYI